MSNQKCAHLKVGYEIVEEFDNGERMGAWLCQECRAVEFQPFTTEIEELRIKSEKYANALMRVLDILPDEYAEAQKAGLSADVAFSVVWEEVTIHIDKTLGVHRGDPCKYCGQSWENVGVGDCPGLVSSTLSGTLIALKEMRDNMGQRNNEESPDQLSE